MNPNVLFNPLINCHNIIIFNDKQIKYILLININYSYCLIISNYLDTIINFNLDKYNRYPAKTNSIQQKMNQLFNKRYE